MIDDMELNGIEKINDVITDFLVPFECTCSMGLDFSYYYGISEITWSLFTTETTDITFTEFVEKEFPDITADIFLWSLLHELGHHETCDSWVEKDQLKFDAKKEELENSTEDYAKSCIDYYYIPDEYEATKWAADYMEEHIEEISELWDKLQEAIMSFYKVNNISE